MASKKTKKPDSLTEAERRERIIRGLTRKRECEETALRIVEELLEPNIEPDRLRQVTPLINDSYYKDIIDERSILKLCGYPLCNRTIRGDSRRYKICRVEKKVYDITERKKFCSDSCFKASAFYEAQLLSEPLWMRDVKDKIIDDIKFYHEDNGPNVVVINKENSNNNIGDFKSFEDADDDEDKDEDIEEEPDDVLPNISDLLRELRINGNKPITNKPSTPRNKKSKSSKASAPKKILLALESKLKEWYTVDTLRFLKGDSWVRERLKEQEDTIVRRSTVGDEESVSPELQKRYVELCRKLDRLDEGKEPVQVNDKDDVFAENFQFNEEVNLKFAAFMKGKTEYESDLSPRKRNKETKSGGFSEIREVDVSQTLPQVPMIDKHAQGALRRRIVHDQLDRVLPELLQLFDLRRVDINDDLRQIVVTFSFTAENILFQRQEWMVVAVIILYMLSDRNSSLKEVFSSASSVKQLEMLLFGLNADVSSVKRIVEYLSSDIYYLLQKMSL